MRPCTRLVSVFLALVLVIPQAKAGEKVAMPNMLDGSWSSEVDFSWGGNLTIRTKNSDGNAIAGDIDFGNSACPGLQPFTGSRNADGSVTLTSDLGGRCGAVRVTLKQAGDEWRGRYVAGYPDEGTVKLAP